MPWNKIYTDDRMLASMFPCNAVLVTEDTIKAGIFEMDDLPKYAMIWTATKGLANLLQDMIYGVGAKEVFPVPPDYDIDAVADMCEQFVGQYQRPPKPDGAKRLEDIEDVDTKNIRHFKTGIELLDKEINGLYAGQVSVLFSYAGEGKSTLASAILNNILVNDETHCLVYSGELEDYVFKDWMLHQLSTEEWVTGKLYGDKFKEYKKLMSRKLNDKFILFEADKQFREDMKFEDATEVNSFVAGALEANLKYDPDIGFVIIDNCMTAMDNLPAGSDVLIAQSNFMESLVEMAKSYQVHIMLICHSRKENFTAEMNMYDISGTANIPNKASTIMSIRRIDKTKNEKDQREEGYSFLSLYKDRYSGARLVKSFSGDDRVPLIYNSVTRNYYQVVNPDCDLATPNPNDIWSMPLEKFQNEIERMMQNG